MPTNPTPPSSDDFKEDVREVIEGLLAPDRKRFVRRRRPVLSLDLEAGTVRQVDEQRFRSRRVPKVSDLRQLLFTAYIGKVHESAWFKNWRRYLHTTYPQFRYNEGAARELAIDYMQSHGLIDAYLASDGPLSLYLPEDLNAEYKRRSAEEVRTFYAAIGSRAIIGKHASAERRYLCRTCGLHAVTRSVFGADWLGETGREHNSYHLPTVMHQWIWAEDDYTPLLLAQTILAEAWAIEPPSGGHGEGLRGIKTVQDVERAATWLFWNQIRQWTPARIAFEKWDRAMFAEDTVKQCLDELRDLLGVHRAVGTPQRVLSAPTQWRECIPRCWPYGVPRRAPSPRRKR